MAQIAKSRLKLRMLIYQTAILKKNLVSKMNLNVSIAKKGVIFVIMTTLREQITGIVIVKKGHCNGCGDEIKHGGKWKNYTPKRPLCDFCSYIKSKYNLSYIDYSLILAKQRNSCAICNRQENEIKARKGKRKFCVDHCHRTGKVRGILCGACNTAIGLLMENDLSMWNAIKYIKLHRHEEDMKKAAKARRKEEIAREKARPKRKFTRKPYNIWNYFR